MTPLVGREGDLEALRAAVSDAQAGRGGFVLVTGEAGIGKTSVLNAVARDVAAAGAQVLWGNCMSMEDAPPLLPWSQVVRAWLKPVGRARARKSLGETAAALARIVPELGVGPLPGATASEVPLELTSSDYERWSLFEAMAAFIEAAASIAPAVIVLDDVHDADILSVQVLRYVVPKLQRQAVLIVAAARADEFAPGHVDILAELSSSTTRVELRGLVQPALAVLVREISGLDVSDSNVELLHRQTGGNPFFTREVLRLIVAEGRLHDFATLPLPDTVQVVLRRRIGGLSSTCQRVLSVAAVAGNEHSIELIRGVCDLEHQLMVAAIDEAVAARLVARAAPDRIRFNHALARAAVYESLGAAERRALHRALGEVLERSSAHEDVPAAELANHFMAAVPDVDAAKAVAYAAAAGHEASAVSAYEDAARHFRDALGAMDLDASTTPHARTAVLLGLAEAQSRAGDRAAATEAFATAATSARVDDDSHALARAALGLGGHMETGSASVALINLLEEALAATVDDAEPIRARVMARLAHALLFTPAVDRRRELATTAVEAARRTGDRAALASALYVWHIVGWTPTNVHERVAACNELCALGERPSDRELAILGHHFLAYDYGEIGDMASMERELAIGARLADELRQPLWQWISEIRTAMRAVMRGRFAEGEQLMTAAFGRGQEIEPDLALLLFGSALAQLRMWQGRAHEIEPAMRRALDTHAHLPAPRCALAAVYSEMGRLDDARIEMDIALRGGAEGLPTESAWLVSVAALIQAASAVEHQAHAALLYELLLPRRGGSIVGPFAETCSGSVDHFLALAAATMGDDRRAADHFAAALEHNRAMGARPALALTQLHYARLLARRDDEARARSLLTEARTVFIELGMTADATRADELAQVLGTERVEVESSRGNEFRLDGAVWRVRFAGQSSLVDDSKGMRDIAYLLARPDHDVHVLDLVAPESRDRGRDRPEPGDELLDASARRAYKARIIELEDDLTEAEHLADEERAALARSERDLLVEELARAMGLGGRSRRQTDRGERARQAVRARVRDAIRRVERVNPRLARHLERSLRTGYFCRYQPEEPVAWEL